MKKILFALMLCLGLLFTSFACADMPSIIANPDLNANNPRSLPYTGEAFKFSSHTTTLAIEGSSDGSITVHLRNARLGVTGNKKARVTARVFYKNTNGYWTEGAAKTLTVTTTAATPSVTLKLPAHRTFYIRLSKTDYPGYNVLGTPYITD